MNRLAAKGQVFTEFDVANAASHEGWSTKHFEQAVKHAYSVLQGDYKKGKLVRFGPVDFKGTKDYARRGTKIMYTSATVGPQSLETPNGEFPRMFAASDNLVRAGRRVGTGRDDTKPWADQQVTIKRESRGPGVDPAPLLKEIQELREANSRLEKLLKATGDGGNGRQVIHDDDAVEVPGRFGELVALLADRLAEDPRLLEGVKTSMAEALIS
jgi:hypothetical protein